ncbi:hypothetical protein [Domibacillus mangrovi]|uniref:Uncharacterized protein n=1 Tax=Domibacillus mangrovi TaxID=1714354 RepID=A0A1Q5NZ77_9BACI|nr:hypothetical protein [Domibacillus mangrovi]OKL35261.1 hypothetical protein BLL40_16425 [Domibacillus mangrovi]
MIERQATLIGQSKQSHATIFKRFEKEVAEHQAKQKQCPCCQFIQTAPFSAPGPVWKLGVQSLLVYLHHGQLLFYDRTVEVVWIFLEPGHFWGTSSVEVLPCSSSMDVLTKRQWVYVYCMTQRVKRLIPFI